MKLITAIIQPKRVDEVRAALEEAGVQGVTISDASGYGRQRGHTEVYRGAEINVELLPKARLEVLVDTKGYKKILDAIVSAAKTGTVGDGKVWVVDVKDVVRVRTGESGPDAV